MTITPVFRSDGSGDTYTFTEYLSKISPAWKSEVGSATTVGWKAGVGAKGNSGITATVVKTPGAIGYISASYLIAAGLGAAAVENKAGNFALPNLKNIESAASTVKSVPSSNAISPNALFTVNHSIGQYAKDFVTTNTVESFFSIFKRGMMGIYQHCGEQHLQRYLTEFDFRYSNRIRLGIDDTTRDALAIKDAAGKRLIYRRISESAEA